MNETSRIQLLPIRSEDIPSLCAILLDETVKKTYMVPDLTYEGAEVLAKKMITLSLDAKRFVRGIYLQQTLVGILNDVGIEDLEIELGWVIAPAHQNNGYATEAVRKAIEMLLQQGFQRVLAGAFSENTPSIRVMQKAGMTLIAKTEDIEYRGCIHNCVYYQFGG